MEAILVSDTSHVLRFDRGEEVMSGLVSYCADNDISGASLTALGAAYEVELAFYDIQTKEYETKTINDATYEIASVVGNVATSDDGIIVHAHGVFSLPNEVHAGHVNKLIVGATCEVALQVHDGTLSRSFNEQIGLKLLHK